MKKIAAKIGKESLIEVAIGTETETGTGLGTIAQTEIATETSTKVVMTQRAEGMKAGTEVTGAVIEITPVRSEEAITTTGGRPARKDLKRAIMKEKVPGEVVPDKDAEETVVETGTGVVTPRRGGRTEIKSMLFGK